MVILCISSVVSFSKDVIPITKEEVEKLIAEAVKAQTEKITRLQTSVSKNTQDIQKNKIKYFSAKMGLGGGDNANNDGAKGPLSLDIGANSIVMGGAIAMGNYSTANGVGAISIGYKSKALDQVATAIEYQAIVAVGNPAELAIVFDTKALRKD
ncbi:hypothetical protein [Fusobacterium periodonticum]|uniref:hypothetical protein n=1 Tax=Fusobacterium periodonticum TaxID=860 RepID=UPI0028D0BBBA|nr:hypothetical protein [Fusobacterium periodonticum]